MDLRVQFPRSVREKIGGYVHLARMIDKCRASLAGTLGDYLYPCPLDNRLLDFTGLTADQFIHAVESRTDQDILDWVRIAATSRSPADLEKWNEMMLTLGPDSEDKRAHFTKIRDGIDSTRTDIMGWADLLDLEEQRPVPIRKNSASSV